MLEGGDGGYSSAALLLGCSGGHGKVKAIPL